MAAGEMENFEIGDLVDNERKKIARGVNDDWMDLPKHWPPDQLK